MANHDHDTQSAPTRDGATELLDDQHLIPDLSVSAGPYSLRFARTNVDLDMVRRLRYAVFNVELGEGLVGAHKTGMDADAFDRQCQHLMVSERESGAVVGTYRMQTAASARNGHGWYTAGEFELDQLPAELLEKSAELGRACVSRAHRDKTVLFLLWHGLITYSRHVEIETFFGCSSLTGTDPKPGVALYAHLVKINKVHPKLHAPPRLTGACPLQDWPLGDDYGDVVIPKLFATYLRYGGRVLGPPAIDLEFGTTDFLMWIDIDERHLKRFGQLR